MRPRPSPRFWVLAFTGALAQAAALAGAVLVTRVWVGPLALLIVVALPLGLARERSLRAMPERRRRAWALVGGGLALVLAAALLVVAFLVAWSIECEGGC